jgi:peptidoglycan LD-endopeptidase LytH
MRRIATILISIGVLLGGAWVAYRWYLGSSNSNLTIRQWLTDSQAYADLATPALMQCPGAPFVIPSEGFIGLLWRDSAAPYNSLNRHTGIDIFGQGAVPIYAVYDGYATRLETWRSTVIVRHDDPLQPGRRIWTYYTHMADRAGESFVADAFPPGTYDKPVAQGTLLGYQGTFNPGFPIARHLHMSIVTSNPDGSFRNEAILDHTLDPSPYFGMNLNADTQSARPVTCADT